MKKVSDEVVAVIGLGYVGLPLAVHFARKYQTIGFDMNKQKVERLAKQVDTTGEVSKEEFTEAVHLTVASDPAKIGKAEFIIVAVPTPIDDAKQPDLWPLESASATTGKYMKKGAVVVFESTVYPGTTEEVCVPIMEMGKFVAEKAVKLMTRSGQNGKRSKVGILGLTFKEDCPDLRNSKVVDIVRELESYKKKGTGK